MQSDTLVDELFRSNLATAVYVGQPCCVAVLRGRVTLYAPVRELCVRMFVWPCVPLCVCVPV